MAEEKKAKKVYTLDEIKFNEENKTVAIVSWISVVGFIMLLIEKKDNVGAQSTVLWLISMCSFIPFIGRLIGMIAGPVAFILMIVGMVKTSKGERFDIPVVSDLALKLMGVI